MQRFFPDTDTTVAPARSAITSIFTEICFRMKIRQISNLKVTYVAGFKIPQSVCKSKKPQHEAK